ncbi:unnamed protein product [Protopolystoma xenopodis]|uniref:EF-hand domain-containing protein n=1 Tax=Protopolystoma xenopodis TaxID=117903 RepID=A0A448XI69_9PLAT|nr:unnamed protein product [Protopolystoma xenopodis]
MSEFQRAFFEIDTDASGSITVEELRAYMEKMHYRETFVTKWVQLFDPEKTGEITYESYCSTLGLIPATRHSISAQGAPDTPQAQSPNLASSLSSQQGLGLETQSCPTTLSAAQMNTNARFGPMEQMTTTPKER